MVATEISDILFGTPTPVRADVNMGCLKEDQVNIIIHGHEPNLFESMLDSVNDPGLIQAAKEAGAKGINLVGMCCSGCRDAMPPRNSPCRAISCPQRRSSSPAPWMPWAWMSSASSRALAKVAECYGTRLFTTNPRCRIEGVQHVPFEERLPRACTDSIVEMAIVRFKNCSLPIEIPQIRNSGIHGFSHEYINYMLGALSDPLYPPQ